MDKNKTQKCNIVDALAKSNPTEKDGVHGIENVIILTLQNQETEKTFKLAMTADNLRGLLRKNIHLSSMDMIHMAQVLKDRNIPVTVQVPENGNVITPEMVDDDLEYASEDEEDSEEPRDKSLGRIENKKPSDKFAYKRKEKNIEQSD